MNWERTDRFIGQDTIFRGGNLFRFNLIKLLNDTLSPLTSETSI